MIKTICIRNRYEQASLHVSDISFLDLENRKVIVHTPNEELWECCSMDEMLYRIDDRRIFRCHHSLAVNLDHIVSFAKGYVKLQDGKAVYMCRAALQRTKRIWERYKFGKKKNTRTGAERRKCVDRRGTAGEDRRNNCTTVSENSGVS